MRIDINGVSLYIRNRGGDFFETKILRQILHVYFRNRWIPELTEDFQPLDNCHQWLLGYPDVGERFYRRSLLLHGLAGTSVHQKIINLSTRRVD